MKFLRISLTSLILLGFSTSTVLAHVSVKPDQVLVATFQTFTVSVPNEKNSPTIALRLVIPNDLTEVTPTVKSGWTIETKKDGDKTTQISWTGGSIPAERRDDFTFSAQAPAKESILIWKVYQTYSDGTAISWDQKTTSGEESESETSGPASETKVVNDLDSKATNQKDPTTTYVAYAALLLSAISLGLGLKKVIKN